MTNDFPTTVHGLVLARDLRAAGRDAELYAAVEAGRLERVRRGAYRIPGHDEHEMPTSELAALRYRARVHAAAEALGRPVFTGHSAIALAGLPIVGPWPTHVTVMSSDSRGSRRPGVVTVARTTEVPTVETDGRATTTIEFALIQLARQASLAAALVATDAALREPRKPEGSEPVTTLDALRAEHERLKPYPGSRRVDAVLRRATAQADSPLETMSRLVIEEFGFPEPILQHRVRLTELNRNADLDFYWPDHGVAAEADGHGKYLVEGGATGAAKAVITEKEREDAIRRRVRGFARWNWAEMWAKEPIRTYLTAVGLPIVRKPVRLIALTPPK
jgi:hypothetical protein